MGITNQAGLAEGAFAVRWIRHESNFAADPCINELIKADGWEAYGRYWRLVEMLCASLAHYVPKRGEQGFKRYALGLSLDEEGLEDFLGTLLELDLIETDENGRYRSPLVDAHVRDMLRNRENGRKGGLAASRNRQQAQAAKGGADDEQSGGVYRF